MTFPEEVTVATDESEEYQVTDLLLAVEGDTVAVSVSLLPTSRDRRVLFRLTPLTAVVTVTLQVADLLPSSDLTVMAEVPFPTAVTLPEDVTDATEELEDDQITDLSLAVEGDTVAVSVSLWPTSRDKVVLFRLTPVTAVVTVTLQVADLPPSSDLTVMVAGPFPTAVTVPLDTVATELLLEDHLSVTSEGTTVATNVSLVPDKRANEVLFRDSSVTGCPACFTVNSAVA